MKIAFCGPSGSGKSTLAKWLSEEYKIPYIENSAGLILPPDVIQRLVDRYGWTRSGHADVIRLGNINPGFAIEFQTELLKVRTKFIMETPQFIFDRSPVDNAAYWLLQCGHISTQQATAEHISNCVNAAEQLTHIILLYPSTKPWVEDNGSRVANWYYQRMVAAVFSQVLSNYMGHLNILALPEWDLETRKRKIRNLMESLF